MIINLDGEHKITELDYIGSMLSQKIQDKVLNETQKIGEEIRNNAEDILHQQWSNFIYDGDTSDLKLSATHKVNRTKNSIECIINVLAEGHAVSFIEFGTGSYHPNNHPYANEFGVTHGSYGKGQGNKPYWYYKGDPSDIRSFGDSELAYKNGKDASDGYKHDVIRTRGNPANRCMYFTYKDVKYLLDKKKVKIKREVANK